MCMCGAHLWTCHAAYLSELRKILSEDERNKETRFHFQRDKDRYVASEGALRAILARYVGMPPAAIRFVRNPHGKPALAAGNRLTSARRDRAQACASTCRTRKTWLCMPSHSGAKWGSM